MAGAVRRRDLALRSTAETERCGWGGSRWGMAFHIRSGSASQFLVTLKCLPVCSTVCIRLSLWGDGPQIVPSSTQTLGQKQTIPGESGVRSVVDVSITCRSRVCTF